MRRIFWIICLLAMSAGIGRGAFARDNGITVSLPAGIPPRSGNWQMLTVQANALPAGAAEISLQDARGGVAVSRGLPTGTAGPVGVLVPLPLLDAAALPGDRWKLNLIVCGEDGAALLRRDVEIPLPTGVETGSSFRFVTAEGERVHAQEQGPWPDLAGAGARGQAGVTMAWAEVPERDILDGPALAFAGVDCVVIPGALRARFTEKRAELLLAAGVRLALLGAAPPEKGTVFWQDLRDAAGRSAWVSQGAPQRPSVIEPGLADLVDWQKPATAGKGVERIIGWFGPAAVVLAILVYELFDRRRAVLPAWFVAMGGLSVVGILVARHAGAQVVHEAAWEQAIATSAGPPAMALRESLEARSPLFARRIDITAENGEILFPVAATSRAYQAWHGVTLHLPDAADEPMRLTGTLPARSVFAYESRSMVPRMASGPSFRVSGGYVSQTRNLHTPENPSGGALFTSWAATWPAPERGALNAWYALRFRAAHDYVISLAPSTIAPLSVVDQGEPPAPPAAR